jgi:hypothetical protein
VSERTSAAPPAPPAPFDRLVGRWRGEGRGLWAADPPFRYREEVVVAATGRPFLLYRQQTWDLADGSPRHAEVGYLRLGEAGALELVVVQPTGIAEVHAGSFDGSTLDLRPVAVTRTPTAKEVSGVERRLVLRGDSLTYRVRIAMHDEPLADHLEATLQRVPDADGGGARTP